MTTPSLETNRFGSPRVLTGAGLILLGVLLLLDRLIGAGGLLRFWPLILIAIGLQQFFNPRTGGVGERTVPVSGIIWLAAGGFFLLNSLGIIRVSVWELFWPAILIAVGMRLMTGSWRRGRHLGADGMPLEASQDTGPVFAVLSGVKRVSAPVPFAGADVTVFMGGAQLDFRRAVLNPGRQAVIDVVAVLGGCELLVPQEWVISAPLLAVLGGVDDKRVVPAQLVIDQTDPQAAAPPRLVIRGVVMMGGITIR